MDKVNDLYFPDGSSGFTSIYHEDSINDSRYKDKHRYSLSEVSFYRSMNSSGIKSLGGNRRISEQRNLPNEFAKKESMKVLLRYLSWQKYPNSISLNELQTPHRSLLISLWNFIFKRVDRSIEINTKNANDEVPRIFKELGYPLAISKSSMVAPGTGQQWSNHLSALCWLCELLIYENEVFPGIAEGAEYKHSDPKNPLNSSVMDGMSEDAISTNYTLNKLVSKSFVPCIIGKENKETVKNAVLSQLEMDLEALRTSHEKKSNSLMILQSNFREMEAILDEHKKRGNQINEMKRDFEKIEDEISESKNRISILDNKTKISKKALQAKSDEYEAELAAIKELVSTLSKQTISKEEVMKIKKSIEDGKATLEQHNETLELFDKDQSKKKEKTQELCQELQNMCNQVNDKLRDCISHSKKLKSPTNQIWNGIQAFKFSYDGSNLDKMIGVNWKEQKRLLTSICKGEEEFLNQIKSELENQSVQTAQKNLNQILQRLSNMKELEATLKKNIEDQEITMNQKDDDIHKLIEIKSKDFEHEEMQLQTKITDTQKEFEMLQQKLNLQTQNHFQECIDKWNKIEELCNDLTQAKIASINGFQKLLETKKENLKKTNFLQ